MRLLLLFSRDDITDENSSMNFVIFSLHVLGDLYIFPMVIFFDKLFPVTLIICLRTYLDSFFLTDLYLLSTYISNPPLLLHFFPCVIQSYTSKKKLEKSSLSAFHVSCKHIMLTLKLILRKSSMNISSSLNFVFID